MFLKRFSYDQNITSGYWMQVSSKDRMSLVFHQGIGVNNWVINWYSAQNAERIWLILEGIFILLSIVCEIVLSAIFSTIQCIRICYGHEIISDEIWSWTSFFLIDVTSKYWFTSWQTFDTYERVFFVVA